MTSKLNLRMTALALATALTTLSGAAFAQKSGGSPADGAITIDQNKALAGAVTPGDNAGFPVTISQNGTYRLTGNLTVPAGVDGIRVAAGVTAVIDMAGFAIIGPANCTSSINCHVQGGNSGIDVGSNASVQVSGGKVRGFNRAGLNGGNGMLRATDMDVTHNGYGILAARLLATRVYAESNSQFGIYTALGTIVDSFAVANLSGIGVTHGVVRGSTSNFNTHGFYLPGSVYQDNNAVGNTAALLSTPQYPGSNNNF